MNSSLHPEAPASGSAESQVSDAVPGRARRVAGSVLVYFIGLVLVGAGTSKLLHVPAVVAEMASLNLTGWKLAAVGCLELISAVLFVVPWLRSVGLVVVSAYLGGAACAHFQAGQYPQIGPALFFIGCCWTGTVLKHPQALWSFNRPRTA